MGCEWDCDEAQSLLHEVVKLWITIRGFSYASAWVEKFKQVNLTPLQNSKDLRKKLNDGNLYLKPEIFNV